MGWREVGHGDGDGDGDGERRIFPLIAHAHAHRPNRLFYQYSTRVLVLHFNSATCPPRILRLHVHTHPQWPTLRPTKTRLLMIRAPSHHPSGLQPPVHAHTTNNNRSAISEHQLCILPLPRDKENTFHLALDGEVSMSSKLVPDEASEVVERM